MRMSVTPVCLHACLKTYSLKGNAELCLDCLLLVLTRGVYCYFRAIIGIVTSAFDWGMFFFSADIDFNAPRDPCILIWSMLAVWRRPQESCFVDNLSNEWRHELFKHRHIGCPRSKPSVPFTTFRRHIPNLKTSRTIEWPGSVGESLHRFESSRGQCYDSVPYS